MSAFGLVVNIIVLWSIIYIDAALGQLRQKGFLVRDEDVARLSRFIHERHINLLRPLNTFINQQRDRTLLFQFQINPIGRCFALPCYSTVCGFAPALGLIWKRN